MPTLWSDTRLVSPADRLVCRQHIEAGSKSFAAASKLLPFAVREKCYALYAFCRVSDDLVDEQDKSVAAIASLRRRLARAYDGVPENTAIDRCFADLVQQSGLPRALPEALIDGLEWDVAGVRCDSLSDLYAYAARVAGSVGAMMTLLMGVTDPVMVARACDLGVAMQLTNIARDVGADAAIGRLYLPRDWLMDAGIDGDQWLNKPVFSPALARVVTRLLANAEQLYQRADSGISGLPTLCRPAIFAARHIYREIGVEVARRGYDSLSGRAVVRGSRKMQLLFRALADSARSPSTARQSPPLPETAFLVQQAAQHGQSMKLAAEPGLGRVSQSILWVASLFATLDDRVRLSQGAE